MKRTISLSTFAVIVLLLTYGLGYWSGPSHAQRGLRVIMARDTGDSPQSRGKADYEPYFTRQNAIPDKVK